MFPLAQRKLIRGCSQHVVAGLHCAADYVANNNELYMPFSGHTEIYSGYEGGNWLRVIPSSGPHAGDRIEFAHLYKYTVAAGERTRGEVLAITGNSGHLTSGPHLHVQIERNGLWVDPESYMWADPATIVLNVPLLFEKVWHRTGATGELRYFARRLQAGTIKDEADLRVKMEYWHGIVYPNGTYSFTGDARWQIEKIKA